MVKLFWLIAGVMLTGIYIVQDGCQCKSGLDVRSSISWKYCIVFKSIYLQAYLIFLCIRYKNVREADGRTERFVWHVSCVLERDNTQPRCLECFSSHLGLLVITWTTLSLWINWGLIRMWLNSTEYFMWKESLSFWCNALFCMTQCETKQYGWLSVSSLVWKHALTLHSSDYTCRSSHCLHKETWCKQLTTVDVSTGRSQLGHQRGHSSSSVNHLHHPPSLIHQLCPRWNKMKIKTDFTDSLCIMGINRVEELLQLLRCQDSIGEVGFEFIKGKLPVIWGPEHKHDLSARCQDSSVRAAAALSGEMTASQIYTGKNHIQVCIGVMEKEGVSVGGWSAADFIHCLCIGKLVW